MSSSSDLSEQCQGLQFLLSPKMLSDALFDVASSAHALAPADDQNLPLTAALSWGVLNPSAIHWLLWQFNMQQRRKFQLTLLCLVGLLSP